MSDVLVTQLCKPHRIRKGNQNHDITVSTVYRAMPFSTPCQTAFTPGGVSHFHNKFHNYFHKDFHNMPGSVSHFHNYFDQMFHNMPGSLFPFSQQADSAAANFDLFSLSSMIEMIIKNCSCQPIFAGIGEQRASSPFSLLKSSWKMVAVAVIRLSSGYIL